MFLSTINMCLLNTSIITVSNSLFPAASLSRTSRFQGRVWRSAAFLLFMLYLESVIFWYGFSKEILRYGFLVSGLQCSHHTQSLSYIWTATNTAERQCKYSPDPHPTGFSRSSPHWWWRNFQGFLCWCQWILYLNPKFSNLTGPIVKRGWKYFKNKTENTETSSWRPLDLF